MRVPKSTIPIVVVTGFAAVCGFLLAVSGKAQLSGATYVPFTAHMVEEHFTDASAAQPTEVTDITYGRRSSGSEVSFTSFHGPDGQIGQLVYILDVSSSKEIQLEPFTKSSMTFYLSPKDLNQRLDSRGCSANTDEMGEHSKLLGYDVVRYREKEGSSYRYTTQDAWVAPYLACFALKQIDATNFGPWNRTTVLSIIEGEPPSSMFDIPPEYVERSPSQLNTAWGAIFHGSQFWSDGALANVEQHYYRQRPGP